MTTKNKNKQMGLHQTKKLLHKEVNHCQNKKATTQQENLFVYHIPKKGLIYICLYNQNKQRIHKDQ